jgi:hypothetical protein
MRSFRTSVLQGREHVSFTGQAQAVAEAEGLISIPPPTPEDARRWAEKLMRQPLE